MTPRPWLAGLAVALAACGSHSARSASPGRTTPSRSPTAVRPYVAPRGPGTAPAAAAPRGGRTFQNAAFTWKVSLNDAISEARSTGRLVFLEAGRDGCGNCEALRNKVIPDLSVNGALGAISVGWYDDVNRNPQTQARSVLYQNLPHAIVLPLVGWVTPDMRWISGYSGRRDAAGFRDEIAKANSIYRQMGAADRPVPEREVAVEPAHGSLPDSSLPDSELADVTAALGEDAIPASVSTEEGARLDPPVAVESVPVESVTVTPTTSFLPEAATPPSSPPPAPTETLPVAPASVVVAPAPDPVRAWAHQELERAASALATRDYAAARAILADVRTRAQGLPEQREAEKGEVAIHLLKKIERQSGEEASKTRSDAARDLRGTVWVSLFA